MAFRISLGQYCAGNSFVHRLDPRAKLAIALIGMISVFFISNTAQLLFAFFVSLGIIVAAQAAPSKVLRSIRPVVIMLLVLSLFNLLLARGGQPLWTCGPFEITTGSIRAALLYPLRMIPAVIIMAILLLTTTPTQLNDAFEAALSPLTRFGLPGHELALVFSLMLRFVPLLADETQAIIDAQTVRGASFKHGSNRLRAVSSILIALLASSLHHADGLSRALDARCYEGGSGRTHWHPLVYTRRDFIAAVLCAAYLALLAFLSTVGMPGPLG